VLLVRPGSDILLAQRIFARLVVGGNERTHRAFEAAAPPIGHSEPGHPFQPGAGTHQCIVCGLDQSWHETRPVDKNPGRGTEFSWQRGKRHGE
jgi:hypothetical protein